MTVRTRGRAAEALFLLAGTGLATGLLILLVVGIDQFIAGIFTGAGS